MGSLLFMVLCLDKEEVPLINYMCNLLQSIYLVSVKNLEVFKQQINTEIIILANCFIVFICHYAHLILLYFSSVQFLTVAQRYNQDPAKIFSGVSHKTVYPK